MIKTTASNGFKSEDGDEALPLLVVDPERVLQLPLHRLHVGVLHQEGGAQLAELADLDLARAVLIDLFEQVLQLLLGGTEAHRPHDLAKIVGREEVLLLRVEQVEAHLQTFDLIHGEAGRLADLLEVNSLVGVRHLGRGLGGEGGGGQQGGE